MSKTQIFSSFYEFLWKMAAPSMYGKVILAFRNCFGGWKDFLLVMGIEPMTQMPPRLHTIFRDFTMFKWVPFWRDPVQKSGDWLLMMRLVIHTNVQLHFTFLTFYCDETFEANFSECLNGFYNYGRLEFRPIFVTFKVFILYKMVHYKGLG